MSLYRGCAVQLINRRDSFDGYWKSVYANTHAIVVGTAFYEHVNRTDLKVASWRPMELPPLWPHWTDVGKQDLESSRSPPTSRRPIPLKHEKIKGWPCAPAPTAFQPLLDDKERPYYELQLAA